MQVIKNASSLFLSRGAQFAFLCVAKRLQQTQAQS
jgi:hypothetical protein